MPWRACKALAAELLRTGRTASERTAGAALVLQFDLYARPSEALGLQYGDLHGAGRSGIFAVVIRPQNANEEGDAADLAAARGGQRRAQPSKNGSVDGSVLVGEAASEKAGRGIVKFFLGALVAARRHHLRKLFPISLAEFESTLKKAAAVLNLTSMRMTPHTARHGGASEDYFQIARDIKSIQARGRWESPRSVGRYRKPGKLCRQLTLLDDARLRPVSEKQLVAWATHQ